ncbi:MAG TPA: hypothetical protein VGC42_12830 [Kofleriaceae bacterium]
MTWSRACGALLVLAFAGCPDRSISQLDSVPSAVTTKDIPVTADLDVLFVIDNSTSTHDKQQAFADNFGRFVDALNAFPTGRPNLHLGVITTSVDIGTDLNDPALTSAACHPLPGQDGLLQNRASEPTNQCGQPTTDRYLSDVAVAGSDARATNYQGTLSDALACIADVGTAGCGFESPLAAIRRALDGSHQPGNAGFLRKGAFLAVVILTDEDDCSTSSPSLFRQPPGAVGGNDLRCSTTAYDCDQAIATGAPGMYTGCKVRRDGFLDDPADYVRFLTGLKGSAGVAVAVIAGDAVPELAFGAIDQPFKQPLALMPSCNTTIQGNYQIARPALRLADFASGFGALGLFRTICQSDYRGALADIGALLFHAVSPCLDGAIDPRDGATANPGLQPDCTVTDLDPDAPSDEPVGALLPACAMASETVPDPAGARPCWWVAPADECAATATGLALHVERATLPAPNTRTRISCAAE